MKSPIYVKSQKDLDSIPLDFKGDVIIQTIGDDGVIIKATWPNWRVVVDNGATVREMRGSAQVWVMRGSAQVREMRGSAQVWEMRGSAQVREMRESAQVWVMRESAQVREMRGSAQVWEMRESAQVWVMRESAQVWVMRESAQVREMRGSAQVREMRGSAQVWVMRGSAQVREMRESAQVWVMRESAQVREMRGSAQVWEMRESAQVWVMRESAQVWVMRESAQVREMRGSAQVREMRGSAQVKKLLGYASIWLMYSTSIVTCCGFNTIRHYVSEKDISITKSINTTVIALPTIREDNTLDMYLQLYPIEKKWKNLIFYKSVRNIDGEYCSNWASDFKYVIGKTKTEKVEMNDNDSCTAGIHISDKSWAIAFGAWWSNQALLELEVSPKDIVVSKDCNGKVRTSKVKVLREVPKEERYL